MAEDDVDGRAGRQTLIEIDNVKPAAIVDPAAPGQITRLANGHRGDVQTQNLQASPGQPDAAESRAASELECLSGGREYLRIGRENLRCLNRIDRCRSLGSRTARPSAAGPPRSQATPYGSGLNEADPSRKLDIHGKVRKINHDRTSWNR